MTDAVSSRISEHFVGEHHHEFVSDVETGVPASLAGLAAIDVARRIEARSVWSFTSVGNQRSQAVMRRLGLGFVRNFDHPNISDEDPTRPHALYMLDLHGLSRRSELRHIAR